MTTQDLLLMHEIACKELKFWCMFSDSEWIGIILKLENEEDNTIILYENKYWSSVQGIEDIEKEKIIWTPPWLARCLRYLIEKNLWEGMYTPWWECMVLISKRDLSKESLLDQSDEVKDFITWLL